MLTHGALNTNLVLSQLRFPPLGNSWASQGQFIGHQPTLGYHRQPTFGNRCDSKQDHDQHTAELVKKLQPDLAAAKHQANCSTGSPCKCVSYLIGQLITHLNQSLQKQKTRRITPAGFVQLKRRGDQARSKITAIPWPPPIHMVTSAYLPPTRSSSYNALVAMKAPEQPTG